LGPCNKGLSRHGLTQVQVRRIMSATHTFNAEVKGFTMTVCGARLKLELLKPLNKLPVWYMWHYCGFYEKAT